MTIREQIVNLRKNKLDLEHSTIMQERGMSLGVAVGYPITILNLIIALQWHLEPWLPLLVSLLVILWVPFYLWFDDRSRKVRVKQAEIDALIRELEGPEPSPP